MPLDFLQHIRTESRRFRDVLTDTDPAQPVPSCPDWNAADLLWHLTRVQDFWARIVETRAATPNDIAEGVRPSSYGYLLTAFDAASARLVEALETTDPGQPVWTWHDDKSVRFILRRQAHEALIHRLDAELTRGAVTALPTPLAADGVLEALDVMYGGSPDWGTFTADGRSVTFTCTDTGDAYWVDLGRFTGTDPDGGKSYDEDDLALGVANGAPSAEVRGTADDLDAWLWHRRPDAAVSITGDESAVAKLLTILEQPIN